MYSETKTFSNFKIKSPFDRHVHLRGLDDLMRFILFYTVRQFWGAVVMPNLPDPITTWQKAAKYKKDIKLVLREQKLPNFTLVMTAYLTDNTDPKNIEEGFKNGTWKAAKLYPHGATTNSNFGVTKLEKIFPVLAVMEKIGMPLLVHPETSADRHNIPFLDRERVYTEESLTLIHEHFPNLIICVEHITTKEAAQFVENCPKNVVGTVTPQHLMYTIDALFHNNIPPYKPGIYTENMCLPILKLQTDVDYIRNAITRGPKRRKFGAGTDTAAHPQENKQKPGSCCGCFTAPVAVELYAQVFDEMGMFENVDDFVIFENFMSVNNLDIYGLTPATEEIVLERIEQKIPELVDGNLRPFKAGQTIPWTVSYRK